MHSDLQSKINNLISILITEHNIFQVTAYATAWVSRIPELQQRTKPAFPESLAWLRQHQQQDGSWGNDNPANPFANTLSTLAAVLALKQWNQDEAKTTVNATRALSQFASQLHGRIQKTFGFELLLSTLVEEFLKTYPGFLSTQTLSRYHKFVQLGNAQREMLKAYQQQTRYRHSNVFWLCLEMFGRDLMLDPQQPWPFSTNNLADNGSILASVAATAYFLAGNRARGNDLPKTYEYLKDLVKANNGGVPPYHPMEQYELTFVLDFLLKGNVPVKLLAPAIKKLQQAWLKRNGLGYSRYSPSLDADDTALGLIVLNKAGLKVDHHSLLQFFNGEYFSHYHEDPTPSLSVNANALRALAYFRENSEVKFIMNKVIDWMKIIMNAPMEQVLHDSWHLSPFYTVSAIIFAIADLNPELNQRCFDWLLSQQHIDGGWGCLNRSTVEETALVILALIHEIQRGNKIKSAILMKAKNFLYSAPHSHECFYMGTTTVYPTYVVAATILAAEYALGSLLS